jgi:hypothetical protein
MKKLELRVLPATVQYQEADVAASDLVRGLKTKNLARDFEQGYDR